MLRMAMAAPRAAVRRLPAVAACWAALAAFHAGAGQVDPAQLVRQLGSATFAQRERASQLLLQLGAQAIPALEAGVRSGDREIRFRSRRLLEAIRQLDFRQRLEAFAADTASDSGYGLPGWSAYRPLAGPSPAARRLFVDMLREEPELVAAIERGPAAVAQQLNRRTEALREASRIYRRPMSLGSVAALLFAAGLDEVAVPEITSQSLYSYCYQPAFSMAIEAGPQRDVLRRILGAWVKKGVGWGAYHGMMLAMRYELKEGVAPARRVLTQPGASPNIRQFAILTVAKLGDRSFAPLLESLLDDQTVCAQQRLGDAFYQTQIRDVALAALVHLYGQDFKQFGFDRVRKHVEYFLTTDSLGFADDAKRQAALAAWRRFARQLNAEADDAAESNDEPARRP